MTVSTASLSALNLSTCVRLWLLRLSRLPMAYHARAGTRGVPRPKIPRTGKSKNVYLRYYFDRFMGKKKYCFKVLARFQKLVPGTPLVGIAL